jgi:integral membrane protein
MENSQLQRAWTIYRNLALIVGIALAVLSFVALPYRYILGNEKNAWTVGAWTAHGWIFPIYLLATLNLSGKLKWPVVKTLLVMIAGTVPLMSFIAERRIAKEIPAKDS